MKGNGFYFIITFGHFSFNKNFRVVARCATIGCGKMGASLMSADYWVSFFCSFSFLILTLLLAVREFILYFSQIAQGL